MGMDVFGNAPTAPEGEYFRNNIWWWGPLAQYVTATFPKETAQCEQWFTNDGDGLDREASEALAEKLAEALSSGDVAEFDAQGHAHVAANPNEPCLLCRGEGIRLAAGGGGTEQCFVCEGTGRVERHFCFSVENVAEFQQFLAHCGGFSIC